jgi:hypothetical protein
LIRLAPQGSKILTVAFIAVAMTAVSLSVSGLLQSTERLGSSGIIIESAPAPMPPAPPAPSPPPPEPAVEIDVYEDLACTTVQSSIEWGEIEAGDSSSVTIYIKNNGDIDILLGLDSENWTPTNINDYTTLSWDYNGTALTPGEIRGVTLTLYIDPDCPPMNNFGFDIVIIGS